MARIFRISGLGADHRLFKNIDLPGHEIILTQALPITGDDTLESYAGQTIKAYHIKPHDVVIGVSLGGMITIEIAKQIPLAHAVLISSIKTIDEAPVYFKLFNKIPVYHLIPDKLFTAGGAFFKHFFGGMKEEDFTLFKSMLQDSSPEFMRWAMHAVLHWQNRQIPPNVYHIHGDADLVFPISKISNAVIIKGGTHIMVFDKADQINRLLQQLVNVP